MIEETEKADQEPQEERKSPHPPDSGAHHRHGVKEDLGRLFRSSKGFVIHLLSIKEGTDVDGTIAGIKRDVEFKGVNVWILIFSIFIASIGLNVNSTAVIIGAMLISPLMGPILGIGLGVGTIDGPLVIRSAKSFTIAVVISVITSAVYFFITPLKEATPELIARTTPTPLDVIVALFGGFAGIIAGSRREKTNVVPGVAIATALMPPLCTAGYGLATWEMDYFFGAFYLFLLNSIFIAIATVVTVRYLHFPEVTFLNERRKRIARIGIIVFILVVIVPSGKIFFDVIQQSIFQQRARQFVEERMNFEGDSTYVFQTNYKFDKQLSRIEIFLEGKPLHPTVEKMLSDQLVDYGLSNSFMLNQTMLVFRQRKDGMSEESSAKLEASLRSGVFSDIYVDQRNLLADKDRHIEILEDQVRSYMGDTLPVHRLRRELEVEYGGIDHFAYAKAVRPGETSYNRDTIPVFLVHWADTMEVEDQAQTATRLERYLKVRLNLDTVQVIPY